MCTRGTNYQNPFGKDPITNRSIYKKANGTTPIGCKSMGVYPSFSPAISSLSVYSSGSGVYSLVYISGANFLPPSYGTTYVNFGSYTKLPITFYSSNNISFVVPLGALPGIYNVKVVNVYNGNFSPAVNQSYPGNQNNSNKLSYQIVGYAINSGTYSITSNSQHNTIITFTANSSITFYRNYAINYIVVGGGGGGTCGAYAGGGGGGGGQVISGLSNVGSNNNYTINIGSGGIGGTTISYINGQNGDNSSLVSSNNNIMANGGQGGYDGNPTGYLNGGNSGSGGQGGLGISGTTPGTTPGEVGINGGGGGGGQAYNGGGGNGGINLVNPNYGGGGGGGTGINNSNYGIGNGGGGNGGGGNGGVGSNGIANTGGGGGGGGGGFGIGGNGGSGVIILFFNA